MLDFFVDAEAMINNQLISLLKVNQNNPLAADCLKQISEASEVRYLEGGLASLNHIIDIYSRRARVNSELNQGMVKGFDELLPALKALTIPSVQLHSLEFLSQWFTVFTDASTSALLGILKSPKKKAVWFDPIKGYDGLS